MNNLNNPEDRTLCHILTTERLDRSKELEEKEEADRPQAQEQTLLTTLENNQIEIDIQSSIEKQNRKLIIQ